MCIMSLLQISIKHSANLLQGMMTQILLETSCTHAMLHFLGPGKFADLECQHAQKCMS